MNTNTEKAELGLSYLKEAVLDVLRKSEAEGRLNPNEIRERLGIPKVEEEHAKRNTLIQGILFHLKDEGHVDKIARKGWKIT
jgi:hypothetical protein